MKFKCPAQLPLRSRNGVLPATHKSFHHHPQASSKCNHCPMIPFFSLFFHPPYSLNRYIECLKWWSPNANDGHFVSVLFLYCLTFSKWEYIIIYKFTLCIYLPVLISRKIKDRLTLMKNFYFFLKIRVEANRPRY